MKKPDQKTVAVICDLDGTLALFNGRGPFEMEKCGSDVVNLPVERTLRIFRDAGIAVLLVSGRFERVRQMTEEWLDAHAIRYDALYLRADGDYRKDAEIKPELYAQHIQPCYEIMLALDDRNQSVECWRSLGIPCWQVAPGDF